MAIKGFWGAGAVDTPPDLTTLQSEGYPTAGDPAKGIPPTKPRAPWFFMIDQMRSTVIHAAQMTPKASDTQFLEALQSLNWVKAKSIEASKIKDGAVGSVALANDSVTATKLAPTIDLANRTLQMKALSTSERTRLTPAKGEFVVDTTTWAVYVGDGSTQGGHLVGGDQQRQIDEIKAVLAALTKAVAVLGNQPKPFGGV